MRAWQERCDACGRRRKVYAYQSLTFYCRRCWTHRDSADSINVNLFVKQWGNHHEMRLGELATLARIGEETKTGRTGPVWELERPAFVILRGGP